MILHSIRLLGFVTRRSVAVAAVFSQPVFIIPVLRKACPSPLVRSHVYSTICLRVGVLRSFKKGVIENLLVQCGTQSLQITRTFVCINIEV